MTGGLCNDKELLVNWHGSEIGEGKPSKRKEKIKMLDLQLERKERVS